MRFIENGPSIPDDLLLARDEGRVVFFCGAGVSRARAGLSDFFGLAEDVIQNLGVSEDSQANKILNEAREIGDRTGVDGLISADRIFGLLERDFLVNDIESAVAKALEPSTDVDISAHRILIDLATTQEGKVRIVTTNFDRLFDSCCDDLQIWKQPRLPDPARQDDMDGIIYLHGCADENYSGSVGDGFILSSSDFGRAYLSDGWATSFFREIIDRYVVVFIGYSADDPPIHYLLEALNKSEGQLNGVYAFQSGLSNEAAARWRHKGVEAIPYTSDDNHKALWESLEQWAVRANDSEKWYESIVNLAKQGPQKLYPYQRGQVAHIISTIQGARKFSEGDVYPPAEWLCVFDSTKRYAEPKFSYGSDVKDDFIDPFERYGLDSDSIPKKIDPDDYSARREIPEDAWDAFAANRLDRKALKEDFFSAVRGHWAINSPRLPTRLNQLGIWIRNVANQPATVWWAAAQRGLHPDIQQQIKWALNQPKVDAEPVVRRGWKYLLNAWGEKTRDYHQAWYELKAMVDKDGWDASSIRELATINRPYLKVEQGLRRGSVPPEENSDIALSDLFRLDVEYPDSIDDDTISDEWIEALVYELRKNLEYALQLETELDSYGLSDIGSIVTDEKFGGNLNRNNYGVTEHLEQFVTIFKRLIGFSVTASKNEMACWPKSDDTIFASLKIWSSIFPSLIDGESFGQIIQELSDEIFWSSYRQRDLLLVIANRWNGLHENIQQTIEERILKGRKKYNSEKDDDYKQRRASGILDRITWLSNNGCKFSFELTDTVKELRNIATGWVPEYADKAVDGMGVQGGSVRTNKEHSVLLDEPIELILSKARKLSGKTGDFLVENDPFAGLVEEKPIRAFRALSNGARKKQYHEGAGRGFVNSEKRNSDRSKFSALIAERISSYPNNETIKFIHPAASWLKNVSKELLRDYPATFEKISLKLVDVICSDSSKSGTSIGGGGGNDWVMEAINSPIGKIAQSVFSDSRLNDLKRGDALPNDWLQFCEKLLKLKSPFREYVIVIFSRSLNWFYFYDAQWVEANLLSIIDGDSGNEKNAFWSGFFWAARTPDKHLFLKMKSKLILMAKDLNLNKRAHNDALAGIILAGWGSISEETNECYISNDEMRDVLLNAGDDFRVRVLSYLGTWSHDRNDKEKRWAKMLPKFISDVWPRQKSVKSPVISARLYELATENPDNYPDLVSLMLPLLTTVDRNHLSLLNIRQSKVDLVKNYPESFLEVLSVILPDDVSAWPYDIDEIFSQISDTDSNLSSDERFLELKRKWNSR